MARYIDIDKIIPELDKNTWQGDMLISILENSVVEDVAPVVHANWIVGDYCSNCEITCDTLYDYCPNCGAKMDKI